METSNHPFSTHILEWYKRFGRQLPWRDSRDPYCIWLSEIILQQTRIDQGMAYYHRFLEAFPSVDLLAQANEDKILRLWQGLGYYSRARNLHRAAKMVVNEFDGNFPKDFKQLLMLPGVGPYTAAAIASIAFNLPYAVVDGNVYRVLSRYFGIETPINSGAGIKEFQQLADELLPAHQAGAYNQGLMDFGSLVCKPFQPECASCELAGSCVALKRDSVAQLPVKQGKTKIRERFLIFSILTDEHGTTLIGKRGTNDIWAGLFQFPMIEAGSRQSLEDFAQLEEFRAFSANKRFRITKISSVVKHILSHQRLFIRFVHIETAKLPHIENYQAIASEDIHLMAMPRAITRYLEEHDFNVLGKK
jgi:A/G-specific adenine glycosylase